MSALDLTRQIANASATSVAHELDIVLTDGARRCGTRRFEVVAVRAAKGGPVEFTVVAR